MPLLNTIDMSEDKLRERFRRIGENQMTAIVGQPNTGDDFDYTTKTPFEVIKGNVDAIVDACIDAGDI